MHPSVIYPLNERCYKLYSNHFIQPLMLNQVPYSRFIILYTVLQNVIILHYQFIQTTNCSDCLLYIYLVKFINFSEIISAVSENFLETDVYYYTSTTNQEMK